jgi:hypothetical protein
VHDPEVISISTFLSVRALLEERVPKKTIARRLGDPRTVRRYAGCLAAGAHELRRARRAAGVRK